MPEQQKKHEFPIIPFMLLGVLIINSAVLAYKYINFYYFKDILADIHSLACTTDCDAVMLSKYALLFGIPTPIFGLASFSLLCYMFSRIHFGTQHPDLKTKINNESTNNPESSQDGDTEQLEGRVAERTSSRLRRTNDRSVLKVHEDHEDDENAEIGVSLHAQDIFLLFKGGLAAGKTTTISMLIKALGVNSETSSPTFMGMHEYSFSLQAGGSLDSISESRQNIQLYHLDLYHKNINLDSVLELMDSDSPQIWMIEWSEKLDQEILDYLYLKHPYIKTFDVELKILEDDMRNLSIRETFKNFGDSNEKEVNKNIEDEVLKWSEQELNQ